MMHGFLRVAAATPACTVADCGANADEMVALAVEAASRGVSLVVFPELSVTGYTCGDLFSQGLLGSAAVAAVRRIAAKTAELPLVSVVGFPLALGNARYNCAAAISGGKVLGVVPKSHIPNYGEFYEARHFTAAPGAADPTGFAVREGSPALSEVPAGVLGADPVPFGTDILFADEISPEVSFAIEICEDLWVPVPPSSAHVQAGAVVVANLSASNEVIGKAEYRKALVLGQSGRGMCAYVYADAGAGESTTDMVFAGHDLIAENGSMLAESALFSGGLLVADVDTERLLQERRRVNTFRNGPAYRRVTCTLLPRGHVREPAKGGFLRAIPRLPFVPADRDDLARRCEEVFALQTAGLAKRLAHTGSRSAVIGLSGGLDSTLALLVTVRAFDLLGLDHTGILAITMPGFGTTKRTRGNALALAAILGTGTEEIRIHKAVRQHFADIGQNPETLDVTYENSQARERTQILMDKANQVGGLVIGTGDLSELALGWATYNGDHMSMYAVNASVPKTLVRHLVRYCADHPESFIADGAPGGESDGGRVSGNPEGNRPNGRANGDAGRARFSKVLRSILDTPVSPELLPPERGEIAQKTEHIVGPYELHDFFLYYLTRWGFAPSKIFALASEAFAGEYDGPTIVSWMKAFYRRFFAQQFKRSCLPDGPKVGSVTLSPRSDWRMPSDASAALWLAEIGEIEEAELARRERKDIP